MKNKLCLSVIFLVSILFFGCIKDENNIAEKSVDQPATELTDDALAILEIYSNKDFEITEEDAIERAKSAISNLDFNPNTRAFSDALVVKNTRALTSENFIADSKAQVEFTATDGKPVKVELPKVLGYAVNFKDQANNDAGFVIVPADKRINHMVLATVPNGSIPLSENEEVDNDGVAFFLDNAEEYAAWSIAEAERKADSLKQAIKAEYQPLYPDQTIDVVFDDSEVDTRAFSLFFRVSTVTTVEKDWWTVSSVDPMLPVEWGQGVPFNDLVKSKRKCNNVVTGCVMTSTAQLMAFWSYPQTVGGQNMNWPVIRKYTGSTSWSKWGRNSPNHWEGSMSFAPSEIRYQAAYLMKNIGESIGADYHCSTKKCKSCGGGGTGAKTEKAVSYLKRLGFKSDGGSSYNFNRVKSALRAGRPILIDGFSTKVKHKFLGITIWSSYKGGHAWNIDGYRERQRTLKTITTIKLGKKILKTKVSYRTETDNLIHNNWGWDGQSNGFFTAGVFNSNNRIDESYIMTRGTDYYYQYKIHLWYNIYR